MGRFVVTHTAAGDRFLLQGEGGRTLAVSRYYANLDACKKGMRSLCRFAPVAPVVDVGAGEYADNPKFALYGGETWRFELMAANGKSVIISPEYATKKACLRAISMLRSGLKTTEAVLSEPAGFRPLTLLPAAEETAGQAAPKVRKTAPVKGLNPPKPIEKTSIPPAPAEPQEPDDVPAAAAEPAPPATPAPKQPAPEKPRATVPRLVRLTPTAGPSQSKPAKKAPEQKRSGWLDRLLKH